MNGLNSSALVFNKTRFSVHDGPGIRTTFFFKGCSLRCLWCQNPESFYPDQEIGLYRTKCVQCGTCRELCGKLDDSCMLPRNKCILCGRCVTNCPTEARFFRAVVYSPEKMYQEALEDQIFYGSDGGVTFSGGECMLQIDFLREILPLCKAGNLHTVIDTSGAAPWSYFARTLAYADLYLYDVKLIDPNRHKMYTGSDNSLILSNLIRLCQYGKAVIIRVPLIPGMTDQSGDMEALADFIRRRLSHRIIRVELLPYNQLAETKYKNSTAYTDLNNIIYPLSGCKTQSKEYLEGLKKIFTDRKIPVFLETF